MRREKNLDALRVLATFMVITLHVSATYVRGNINNINIYFTLGNFFNSFTRVCVPIFVMLSGAFLIDNPDNQIYGCFYKKTLKNIIVPTLIWSVLYFIYSIIILVIRDTIMAENINMMEYIRPFLAWIKGEPFYHLWYMYMIIGLYIFTPILIKLKDRIGEVKLLKLSFILIVIGMIIEVKINLIWPIKFIQYLGYFIIGYSLRRNYKEKCRNPFYFIGGYIIFSLLIFAITEIVVSQSLIQDNKLYFYGYLTPFVCGGAICLFVAFINMKGINIYIGKFSENSFGIYLIHAFILSLIELFLIKDLGKDYNPIWCIPIVSVAIFLVSYKFIEVLKRIKVKGFSNLGI